MSAAVYPRAGGSAREPESAGTLLDLTLELLDDLGHGLAHAAELPVLDLDHAQGVGGPHRSGALLLLEQALLAENVAGAQLGDLLAVALDLRRAFLDHVEVVGVAAF